MNASIESHVPKILLIVEDQVLLAMVLKDELEDGGYRVLELAMRHQEALGLAHEVKPDLALVNTSGPYRTGPRKAFSSGEGFISARTSNMRGAYPMAKPRPLSA